MKRKSDTKKRQTYTSIGYSLRENEIEYRYTVFPIILLFKSFTSTECDFFLNFSRFLCIVAAGNKVHIQRDQLSLFEQNCGLEYPSNIFRSSADAAGCRYQGKKQLTNIYKCESVFVCSGKDFFCIIKTGEQSTFYPGNPSQFQKFPRAKAEWKLVV